MYSMFVIKIDEVEVNGPPARLGEVWTSLSIDISTHRWILTDLVVAFRGLWRSRPSDLRLRLHRIWLSLILRDNVPEAYPFQIYQRILMIKTAYPFAQQDISR